MSDIIGIGTDITECLRIARMIERHGELFVNRVYTPEETRYCQNRAQSTQHFTGRWAAKEAILKALGTGWRKGISWRDVEGLFAAIGAEVSEGKGSRVRVALGGIRAVFHRPHPQKEVDTGMVKSVRRFLAEAGVKP